MSRKNLANAESVTVKQVGDQLILNKHIPDAVAVTVYDLNGREQAQQLWSGSSQELVLKSAYQPSSGLYVVHLRES